MYCKKCEKKLSDDNLFCPYCGEKTIEESKSSICIKCGNEIPDDSDFCPFCGTSSKAKPEYETESFGKQSLKEKTIDTYSSTDSSEKKSKGKIKLTKAMAAIIALSLVIVALATLSIIQFVETNKIAKQNEETVQLKDKALQAKENSVKHYMDLYEDEKDRYEELEEKSDQWADDSYFLFTCIAIVYDDGSDYYHAYGCTHHNSDEFWAYNVEAAKGRGYKPCTYCHRYSS